MNEIEKVYSKIYNDIEITFDEYVIFVKSYGETEFYYKLNKYGTDRGKDRNGGMTGYLFWDETARQLLQSYDSIDEFAKKANIKGKLLKDIWDEVSGVNPLD